LITPLSEKVTAVKARALPSTTVDVPTVTASPAIMVPRKFDDVPKVADVPIAQKTLDALALFSSSNDVAVAVLKVVSVRKINFAFGSPLASSLIVAAEKVNLPVAEQYTPG